MSRWTKWYAAVSLAAAFAASAVAAPDEPKPPAPPPVDVKLAAKPGTVLRFRHTESSLTEANGRTYSGKDLEHEYTATVKAARADGGLDLEVRYDLVKGKLPSRTGGEPREFESGKPVPADADAATKLMISIATAVTSKPIAVSLNARGGVVAVKGLREIWMETIKGTPFESAFSAEKDFSDAKCVEEVAPLFAATPSEPHAVGVAWTADLKERVDTQTLDFAAKFAVSAADAEQATVAAKLEWKPNAEAVANGAKASGGGSCVARFSRRDGFVLSATKDLKAARDTGAMKANSRTLHRIERIEAPPKTK
jgi:hypothetical protein